VAVVVLAALLIEGGWRLTRWRAGFALRPRSGPARLRG
jgi:hypothetical protein